MPIWGYPPKVWTKCDFYENRLFLEKYQKIIKRLYFWSPRAPPKIKIMFGADFFIIVGALGPLGGPQGPQKSNFIKFLGGDPGPRGRRRPR